MEETPPPEQPQDEDLLAQAAAGDGKAFHALMDRHAQGLYRMAMALMGNAEDAQDVVQETLIGAWRGRSGFGARASVKTWLRAILIRQAAQWERRRRRTQALPDDAPAAAQRTQERMDVHAALTRLSREHREVVVLREFGGMSYEEIAAALGVPRGTVESRLHRARRELQELLKAYGSDR